MGEERLIVLQMSEDTALRLRAYVLPLPATDPGNQSVDGQQSQGRLCGWGDT